MNRAFSTMFILTLLGALAIDCAGTSTPPTPGRVQGSALPGSADEAPPANGESPSTANAAPVPADSEQPEKGGDPCAAQECPDDAYCDLQAVTCVRAPCPPVPTCVPGTHPCAATTCAQGSRCESHDGKGVCLPIGDPTACGKSSCEPGMVCCNASCGICTPPDGACTQQACD